MKQIPNIISTKDLSYIEDIFNWNFVICKKALAYKNQVEDSQISDFLQTISNEHEKICKNLIKKLG